MLRDTEEPARSELKVHRGKTAMARYKASRPIAMALAEGLITRDTTVFDYGCGRGGDVRFLEGKCAEISGWDPAHRSAVPVTPADVVNLGYVLNVIEDVCERAEALRRAFSLTRRVLIISVRVDQVPDNFVEFGDGYLTGSNTFQKLYTQGELREYVESALGTRCVVAGLGTVYVFADEQAETEYLANRAFTRRLEYRADLIEEFKRSSLAKRFVKQANKLGRLPLPLEFKDYAKLTEAFGSPNRIERLTLRHIDPEKFEGSREQRRSDILTYFAALQLQGRKPPPFGILPLTVRKDIRVLWPSYVAAVKESTQFLFSLGKPDLVKRACVECGVGKLLPSDLYVHASVEDDLPPLLRLLLFAARNVVGTVEWTVAKLALDGRAVSYLQYDSFDEDPHPALKRSIRVYLPRASYGIREYSGSGNPPILHRKEAFVRPDYPHYETFRQLTAAEEAADLLSMPNIGFRNDWEQLLIGTGWSLVGHSLSRRPAGGGNGEASTV